jgi:hypothetical protein
MQSLLANAGTIDFSQTNLPILLYCTGEFVAVCLLVFLIIALAIRRQHRQTEILCTLAAFWGLILVGSLAYTTITQITWSQQHTQQLMSGYLDPTDTSDRPQLPWILWLTLAATYVLLTLWTLSQNNPPGPQPPVPPPPLA